MLGIMNGLGSCIYGTVGTPVFLNSKIISPIRIDLCPFQKESKKPRSDPSQGNLLTLLFYLDLIG